MNAKKIVMLLAVIAIAFGIISTMNSGDTSSTVEESPVEKLLLQKTLLLKVRY